MLIDISLCNGVGCKIKDTCQRYIEHIKLSGYEIAWYIEPKFEDFKCNNYINYEKEK